MYFSKYEINKTKIIPQKYIPFGKKQAKRDVFFHNNKHRTEDVSQNYDEVKYAREQKTCGMLENYIKWFCSEFGGDGNEKNAD